MGCFGLAVLVEHFFGVAEGGGVLVSGWDFLLLGGGGTTIWGFKELNDSNEDSNENGNGDSNGDGDGEDDGEGDGGSDGDF